MKTLLLRVRMAWHVLQGRPLMYRMYVKGGGMNLRPDSWVIDSWVEGVDVGLRMPGDGPFLDDPSDYLTGYVRTIGR